MSEFNERTIANMNVVLERVCRELPNGGGHEERKFIAERLMERARSGRATLGEFEIVARRALHDLSHKKSA